LEAVSKVIRLDFLLFVDNQDFSYSLFLLNQKRKTEVKMIKTSNMIINIIIAMSVALLTNNLAQGQSRDAKAAEILETFREQYEASIEGIEDFVVVAEQHTTYYKKAWDNGRPYFKSRSEFQMRKEDETDYDSWNIFSPEKYDEIKRNASYHGTTNINGHEVHVIQIENPKVMMDEFDDDEYVEDIRDFHLYIDPGDWVIRKIEFDVQFNTDDGEMRNGEIQVTESDFRDVEGMMVAYKSEIIYSGLALTDEQRREAEEGLKEMEKEMENMPDAQREMMEKMMGDKMGDFRKMIEDDQLEFVHVVKEVKVNTGLEDFD
jgi:hypothetical protein